MPESQTAQEITSKWSQNLAASTPQIIRGVERVEQSPTALAVPHLEKAKQRYQAAIDSGKMKKRLLAVSKEEWQAKTKAKVGNIAQGASLAEPLVAQFHEQRSGHQRTIDSELSKMGSRTAAEQDQRMLHQVKRMRDFAFNRS